MTKRKYTPAKVFISEPVTSDGDITDPLLDKVIESIAKALELPTSHTMAEGENILTVARRYLPEGMTRSEYATSLDKTNSSFAVGRIINLG